MRISPSAATLCVPTCVETVYGMNFSNMPELDYQWGYPFAVALMIAMGAGLYTALRGKGRLFSEAAEVAAATTEVSPTEAAAATEVAATTEITSARATSAVRARSAIAGRVTPGIS